VISQLDDFPADAHYACLGKCCLAKAGIIHRFPKGVPVPTTIKPVTRDEFSGGSSSVISQGFYPNKCCGLYWFSKSSSHGALTAYRRFRSLSLLQISGIVLHITTIRITTI